VVDAGTVTFNVSWKKTDMPAVWLDSAWVFVDYNDAGTMKRLPLLPGATLTATSAPGIGRVAEEPGNDKGIWVIGNARTNGSFSATVKLLTANTTATGACAYASNYPPVWKYTSATKISFTGTPMYEIALAHSGGGNETVKSGDTFLLPCDYTVTSFTDATGAPGIGQLPVTMYTLTAPANVCEGAQVTLTLAGSLNGWQYKLYRNETFVNEMTTGTGSAITFYDTPSTGTYNYTVKTEIPGAENFEFTVSKSACTVEITGPTITWLSGNPIQIIISPSASITDITYTTTNASSVTVSGLPAGLIATWSANTCTIHGQIANTATPAAYQYIVATTNIYGCTDATSTGTISVCTVNGNATICPAGGPTNAKTTTTWHIGSLVWSDVITKASPAGCTNITSGVPSGAASRQYIDYNELRYYNGECFEKDSAAICPSPWRVPTLSDVDVLETTKVTATGMGWVPTTWFYWNLSSCCENDYYHWQMRTPTRRDYYAYGEGVSLSKGGGNWYPDAFLVVRCVRP
jgi:hypothetical protein